LVDVPPLPLASPRPILFSLCVEPFAGFSVCSFILFDFVLTGYHPSLVNLIIQDFCDLEIIVQKSSNQHIIKSSTQISSTLIRWFTLLTIPNICGVASTSTEAFIFFNPKATIVLFWRSERSMTLLTCVTFIFFIPLSPKGGLTFLINKLPIHNSPSGDGGFIR